MQVLRPRGGLSSLEPVDGSGEAEHADEADGGLLVSGRDGAPFLKPGPEALDLVAVVVDPVRAGDGGLVALGRDRWPCAHVPDVLTDGVAGVVATADDLERLTERARIGRAGVDLDGSSASAR